MFLVVRSPEEFTRAPGSGVSSLFKQQIGQPGNDPGKSHAQPQNDRLDGQEGCNGFVNVRHRDIGWRDTLQIEKCETVWRCLNGNFHIEDHKKGCHL